MLELKPLLQALLLPRLSWSDIKSFGQVCAAARAIVTSTDMALLQELTQVRPACKGHPVVPLSIYLTSCAGPALALRCWWEPV